MMREELCTVCAFTLHLISIQETALEVQTALCSHVRFNTVFGFQRYAWPPCSSCGLGLVLASKRKMNSYIFTWVWTQINFLKDSGHEMNRHPSEKRLLFTPFCYSNVSICGQCLIQPHLIVSHPMGNKEFGKSWSGKTSGFTQRHSIYGICYLIHSVCISLYQIYDLKHSELSYVIIVTRCITSFHMVNVIQLVWSKEGQNLQKLEALLPAMLIHG